MKILDIETDNKLLLKFKYKEKSYSMVVVLIAKNNRYIVIPSILERNQVIIPTALKEAEIIYTVKDGIFSFHDLDIQTATFGDMRVYNVSSFEEVTRVNRRDAYRVFIGEVVTVTVIMENGKNKDIEGILRDVSTTGMGIVTKQEFQVGTTMKIIYNFEGLYFLLLGKVIRKEKMNGFRAFTYGCMFKEPNNGINRVILQKQLRNGNHYKGTIQKG